MFQGLYFFFVLFFTAGVLSHVIVPLIKVTGLGGNCSLYHHISITFHQTLRINALTTNRTCNPLFPLNWNVRSCSGQKKSVPKAYSNSHPDVGRGLRTYPKFKDIVNLPQPTKSYMQCSHRSHAAARWQNSFGFIQPWCPGWTVQLMSSERSSETEGCLQHLKNQCQFWRT